jgi:hypothetical protein
MFGELSAAAECHRIHVKERGVSEPQGLAVEVVQPPRERDAFLGVCHRGMLFAQQPVSVRVPGVREHGSSPPVSVMPHDDRPQVGRDQTARQILSGGDSGYPVRAWR